MKWSFETEASKTCSNSRCRDAGGPRKLCWACDSSSLHWVKTYNDTFDPVKYLFRLFIHPPYHNTKSTNTVVPRPLYKCIYQRILTYLTKVCGPSHSSPLPIQLPSYMLCRHLPSTQTTKCTRVYSMCPSSRAMTRNTRQAGNKSFTSVMRFCLSVLVHVVHTETPADVKHFFCPLSSTQVNVVCFRSITKESNNNHGQSSSTRSPYSRLFSKDCARNAKSPCRNLHPTNVPSPNHTIQNNIRYTVVGGPSGEKPENMPTIPMTQMRPRIPRATLSCSPPSPRST